MKYEKSVAVTWQTTVEQLGIAERQLFNALAWVGPEPVPISVLENWSVGGIEAGNALAELAAWNLARWTVDKDAFTIHRLVQEITTRGLSEEEKTTSLRSMLAQTKARLPDPEWSEAGWRLWEQLAPHIRMLLHHVEGHQIEVAATSTMNQYGLWLVYRTQYPEAEPILERALSIRERALGPEHPEVATSLNELARLYQNQGRYAEAESPLERALSIRERALGPEHPEVATSLNELARCVVWRIASSS
jgi:tetratricopeptide (TPR) repeat protein